MSIWTIKGATGAALSATEVDLELMAMEAAALEFQAQGDDRFSFFLPSPDPVSDPAYLPDYLQTISVWRSGVRQFQGQVLEPEFVWDGGRIGWNIRAEGGWPELDKVPLVAANSYYTRAQGNLTTSIQAVIDVAIAGGAQIVRGTIATTFNIPPVSFRAMSCAAALMELLRWIPDASLIFDYTPAGLPVLNLVRRTAMTLKTWTLGTDEISVCRLSPVAGQTPDKVVLTYPIADVNGVVTEVTQTAGAGTAAAQAVVFSDPSLAAFQTNAAAAQVAMQTITSATTAYVLARAPNLQKIVGLPAPTFTGAYTIPAGGTYTTKGSIVMAGINPALSGFTAPNTNALLTGELKDYMLSRLSITQGVCTYKGTLWWKYQNEDASGPVAAPDWAAPLVAAGGILRPADWWTTGTGGANVQSNPNTWTASNIFLYVEFEAPAISRAFTSLTNVRDPGDYSQLAPPSDLATNLLAVQNFIPFKGRIETTPFESWARLLGYKHDIGAGNPRLSGIAAIPSSERIDIQTGIRELSFGSPNRKAMTSLMTRFRSI